jgi:hypothetical protein
MRNTIATAVAALVLLVCTQEKASAGTWVLQAALQGASSATSQGTLSSNCG